MPKFRNKITFEPTTRSPINDIRKTFNPCLKIDIRTQPGTCVVTCYRKRETNFKIKQRRTHKEGTISAADKVSYFFPNFFSIRKDQVAIRIQFELILSRS